MRTLKLTVAYDGTRYAGWQIQKSRSLGPGTAGRGNHKATIQGTLERVLCRILREPVKVAGSGRTDAGVHAEAQIAHITTRATVSTDRLLRSVNQLLPTDIAVTSAQDANGSFHARFDAIRKRYRYRVCLHPVVSPFIRPYVHHVRAALNLAAMRREAVALRGRHDFRAFARAGSTKGSTRRTVSAVRLIRRADELHVEVEGDGFLHTMVRSMVGTLLDVGRGRLPEGTIRRMLRTGERRLAGATAPAHGLTLINVEYS